MPLDIFDIALLIGSVQGLLLAILIFHKHHRLLANRFLGILMLLYGLIFLDLLLWEIGFYFHYPHIKLLLAGLAFLVGPLHYLYAINLMQQPNKFAQKNWLHFLPFVVYKLSLLPDFVSSATTLSRAFTEIEGGRLQIDAMLFNWLINIQALVYMGLTLALLARYSRQIKEVFSNIEKIQLDWLRNITLITSFAWLIFLLENVFFAAGINLSDYFNFSSLLGAISVYAIGYLGLSRSEVFSTPAFARSLRQLPTTADRSSDPQNQLRSAAKYVKSGLSSERAKRYLVRLLKLMQEKQPFLNSELTLDNLADLLSIPPYHLSEVINTQLGQNFFDFVNHYRVEEAKKLLADPGKAHLKILGVAFESGFNSKTSFNTIFKKHTKMTPSTYRQSADVNAPS